MGYLRSYPKKIAENLERELRAKAELFLAEIKWKMLTKAKVDEGSGERFPSANSEGQRVRTAQFIDSALQASASTPLRSLERP
jgi:hypothetical protein